MIATVLWALIAGVILGYLGKLLLPGRQRIPAWATILAGVVAALVGGLIADWLGVGQTRGIDWWRHIIQVGLAVLAIWAVARVYEQRGTTAVRRRS
ncbi:MAG TPA: GlsB/YeaQ/YmgE family stress response membrane protein [Micromonosporaceae bacterium]